MNIEDYFDFISPDDIRIKGHRIGIETVLKYFLNGYTPEEIAALYPDLSLEKIYATITYYFHQKVSVNAYLIRLKSWQDQRYEEWVNNPSPLIQRLQKVRDQKLASIGKL